MGRSGEAAGGRVTQFFWVHCTGPWLAALALLATAGCCDPGAAIDFADLARIPSDGALGLAEAGSNDAADCADDLGGRALGGACLHRVEGRVVDEAGGAVAGATITVCAQACFYGKTDLSGAFVVAVDQYLKAADYALLAHVNPRRASFYLALPPVVDGVAVFPAPIVARPMPTEGPAIVDDMTAKVVSAGGVTLTISDGTVLFFSGEDFADQPLGAQFRPLRLIAEEAAPLLGGVVADVVYGFGPFEIDFRQPVRLSFENTLGLPRNSPVEVLAQRGLIRGGPPGFRFDVVAQAAVTADGARIDMAPGAGLDTLTWIALRKKGP